MLSKIAIAASLAFATFAAPAVANDFGGIYIQGTAGVEDVRDRSDIMYGASAGVNIPLGDAIVGVEATLDNVFADQREVGASARLGYDLGGLMPYVEAGYANVADRDGLRLGGGLEYNISTNAFVSAEYRYTDFDAGAGKHAGLVGLGLRF